MLQKHKVLPQVHDTDDIKEENSSACACNYLNNRISVEYSVNLTALHKIGRKLHFTILFAHFTAHCIFCTAHIATLCTLNFTLRHTTPAHCITLVLTLNTTHSSPYHKLMHYTLYFTLYYTTLHTKLHYTTLHTTLHYTALHYTTLNHTTQHYTTLYYTALHCTTLHYTALHSTTLHYTTLHYTTLHHTTLHDPVRHCHLPWELGRRRIEVCSSFRSLH